MNLLKNGLAALLIVSLASCSERRPAEAQTEPGPLTRSTAAPAPTNTAGLAVATFAGGCFWATEEVFEELRGVKAAVSGYSGGTVANPSYEEVGTERTGHAEAVQVYYDPKQISYQQLAEVFFKAAHDPTTPNRQGPDMGPQYRSAVFYRTPQEKKVLDETIGRVNAGRQYSSPVVTQVQPFRQFWPAEGYHQGYLRLHPRESYIQNISMMKVEKVRHTFPQLLKKPL
ncbi:peptide-methionine (S)-S-oxide reductase MsrA [Hymenobacter sp. UYP22]|uniref:peptide-methionine (S)-S-oxide reductase MsrA n=1 Tax=Hymenobacter sp. UYP22 TaxID=3156348 RepID=UPI00339B3C59